MSSIERLARPSSSAARRPPPEREPTRLEILKTKKGRPFAGENSDLRTDFTLSSGIINYTGHLPGLHSSIGTSYPNLAKKSAMFLEEKGQPGWGGPRVPINDAQHDKWGSMKPLPDQLKKDIANLYLSASNPSVPIDPSVGVGCSPARHSQPPSDITRKYFGHTIADGNGPNGTNQLSVSPQRGGSVGGSGFSPSRYGSSYQHQQQLQQQTTVESSAARSPSRAVVGASSGALGSALVPSSRVPMDEPRHIAGYKGHLAGTRHMYGENFNRIDHRARLATDRYGAGGKGVTAVVTAASPARVFGEYESHNLVMANRNAIPH